MSTGCPGYSNPSAPLMDFLEGFRARPCVAGLEWARDHWHSAQSIIDRVSVLRTKAKSKPGRGKSTVCAVLGAALAAAIQERAARHCQDTAAIESLQALVQSLRVRIADLQGKLEDEKAHSDNLQKVLGDVLAEHAASPQAEAAACLRPLIKMEYSYEGNQDQAPLITTKEVPYTATELAKLKREFSRHPRETETEYVWRVSLTGGDQILLSEKEAEGYWGPGVFLTTADHRAPWSLTQRAAYWAGGLNPLERGDPLAIEGTADQLLESVHKAACLQMMCSRKLVPFQESPMMLTVDAERLTPLIRGLPDSLKPLGIQLQGSIQALGPLERMAAALQSTNSSPARDAPTQGGKVWTWGDVAQELINFGRKYGPVKAAGSRPETRAVRPTRLSPRLSPRNSPRLSPRIPPRSNQGGRDRPLTRHAIWTEGWQKGIPKKVMDGLSTDYWSRW
uniref:Uncharacterized protein n=1 Tax=Malurus cyaneus samueli TaxID=2593467 RepID=A0A8C5TJH5_9PASS